LFPLVQKAVRPVGARQSRLIEDLAGIFRGEILVDPISQALYASDGSLHQITPFGVAYPRDRDDVVTLMRYASENRLPVVPRGAGTSVGGEALGTGIIIDFSRYMNKTKTWERRRFEFSRVLFIVA
jgi:FAD/FMN-containing dehydrogenase